MNNNKQLDKLKNINEAVVYKLHSGIIVVDHNLQILLINPAASKLFDHVFELNGMQLSDLSSELADKLLQWSNDPQASTQKKHTVLAQPEAIVHFLPGDSDILALIVLDDMRRMMQHAQQLKLASLGRFTASMAHELRNPLGAIAHATQLLCESENINQQDRRLTEIISQNCDRMNSVIKNMLQLSRRTKSEPRQIVLKPFLENFVNEFLRFNQAQVKFNINVVDDEMVIFLDKSQLTQILVNLCENAVRYGKNQQGEAIIDLIANVDHNQASFIQVKDHGIGIQPQVKERLFEPFYTTSRVGTGMGLFITKELCQANQVQLSVDDCNSGACFKISFNKNEELIL